MIRTILLDAGGVLVRPAHADWHIPAKLYETLGDRAQNVPGEAWRAAHRRNFDLIREDVLLSVADEYVQRRKYLAAMSHDLNWRLTEDELNALAWDFTVNEKRYVWYDDVAPVLTRLHQKYQIGILSDAMPSFGLFARSFEGERGFFDAIALSTKVGACKPEPKMYQSVLRMLNAEPAECVFVDDRAGNLEGAEKIGIRGIQMLRDGLTQDWRGAAVRNLNALEALLEAEN